jgi:hypothetical protein
MGCIKNYLATLICLCSDEQFGQDAVEHAILNGAITLTYDRETDLVAIMGQPGRPETGRYDEFCETWRRTCAENEAALVQSCEASGLLEEILRPIPLAKAA